MTHGGSSRRKQNAPRPRLIQASPPTLDDQRSITTDEDEGSDQNPQASPTTHHLLPNDRKRPYNVSVDPARYRRVSDPDNPDAVKFACSLCGNLYKWRKSLNKHWKEKHHDEHPPPLDAPVLVRQSKIASKPAVDMIPKATIPMPHPAFPFHPYSWFNLAQQLLPSISTDASSNVPLDLTMKKSRRLSSETNEAEITHKKFHRDSPTSTEDQCDSANVITVDENPFSNGQKLFICSICDERCLSIDAINTHFIDQHLDEFHQQLLEPTSPKTTNERLIFNDPTNPLKCFHCDFIARWPTELQKHAASHSTLRPFKCLICSLTYKWRWDLAKHWDRAHALARKGISLTNPYKRRDRSPSTLIEIEQKKDERQYACRWCDYRGRWRSELIQHMRCHHAREKPYRCSICSYASSWKWDVQKHLKKQHANIDAKIIELSDDYLFGGEKKSLSTHRIYLCEQCPFTTNSIGEYRRHLIVHSSACPYRCFHCSYQSKWKSEVKKHMKEHNHPGAIIDPDDDSADEEIDRLDEKPATMFDQCSVCLSNDGEDGEEADSVRHGVEHETVRRI